MRFVLVGTAYPHRGGIAHYVALLSRELLAAGHAVKVVSFSRQYPGLLFPGKTQDDAGPETIRVDSERLIDTVNPFTWLRAGSRIAAFEPDMVVYKYWMPFFAPAYGIDEDPVTGSAHCCLGPYWAAKLGREEVTGRQVSARGGIVRVTPRGGRVSLSGQAVRVMKGELA